MTPTMEKFYQKRLEESGIVFSYDNESQLIRVEQKGEVFFFPNAIRYQTPNVKEPEWESF